MIFDEEKSGVKSGVKFLKWWEVKITITHTQNHLWIGKMVFKVYLKLFIKGEVMNSIFSFIYITNCEEGSVWNELRWN